MYKIKIKKPDVSGTNVKVNLNIVEISQLSDIIEVFLSLNFEQRAELVNQVNKYGI